MKKTLTFIALAAGVQLAAFAGFPEGLSAYNARQYDEALKQLAPLAQKGHADAQNLLGLMYYTGQGVKQDYSQAAAWFAKAGAQNKADAQYVLGAMYYTGKGVPQDYKSAVGWFRKAAEKGHAEAQRLLGMMYQHAAGGMPRDMVLAYMLWNLAAAKGNAEAAEMRNAAARRMSTEQIEEAQSLSSAWKPGTALPTSSRTGLDAS